MKIPSVSHDLTNLEKIIDFSYKFFEKTPLVVKKFTNQKKPSLIISTKPTKNLKILLAGHLDVVDGQKNIMTPKIKGDLLMGRGAADMKTQCAVMMHIMKDLSQLDKKPSVGLMLTTDEEVGGENGIQFLLQKKGFRSDLAFIPDGLGSFQISSAQKGILILKIIKTGISTHGSTPWNGENPIEKFLEEYAVFRKTFFKKLKSPDYWQNTCSLNIIQSGESSNKIPDKLEAVLDIRFTSNDFRKILEKNLQKYFPNSNFIILNSGSALELKDKSLLKSFYLLAKKHLGPTTGIIREHGASDARHFAAFNIPSIIINPDCGGLHSDNEWANLKSIENYYNLLKDFILQKGF